MCLYRYVYYSRCQHPELIRVSYCDRAKALGHPQRDDRYRRNAGADNPSGRPPDYPSHASSYPSHSLPSLATHHQSMSTMVPWDAGADPSWAERGQRRSLPTADRIPRSARGYSNVNIDIPLDSQSSLSMELTHDGKVMELVARYESFTGDEDSDPEQAHHRDRLRSHSNATVTGLSKGKQPALYLEESDSDTVRASPARIGGAKEPISPRADRTLHSPRKPIPSPWKITQPRAPVFQTDRRKEEREKRKSQAYLTKDASKAVDTDIASVAGPSSPTKLSRRQSKASLQSPASSPARSSPRQAASIKIQVSPTRSARSNVQDQGRTPSVAPSVISNQGSEYHSAHSPVSMAPSRALSKRSSDESFHSAATHNLDPLPLSLTNADGVKQTADIRGEPAAQAVSHSRSKTEPRTVGPKFIRPAVPNLTLRIPGAGAQATMRKSQSASVSPSSPTKSSSRIPRISPTYDASTTASSLKRSQSTKSLKETKSSDVARSSHDSSKEIIADKYASRAGKMSTRDPREIPLPVTPIAVPSLRHVRTLDSTGKTPILTHDPPPRTGEQPYASAKVASYLDSIDPDDRPDHTPFTEEESISESSYSEQSSRKTSTSTVKANKSTALGESSRDQTEFSSEAENKPSGLAEGGKINPGRELDPYDLGGTQATHAETREHKIGVEDTSSRVGKDDQKLRGPGDQHKPQTLRQNSAGAQSLRSKASTELRADAPEFVPQAQDELQASAQNAMTTQWMQPLTHNLPYDPFAIDGYGMPWFFHMYPVQMKQIFKSPKKYKTMPRSRKRGEASITPKKSTRSALKNENQVQGPAETHEESSKDAITPFASQLDEIARNATARQGKEISSPLRRGYMTMPPRSGRPLRNVGNGLYDTLGRGRARIGMPIEATAPFPDPIPPSGRKEYVGYSIQRTADGCGAVDIDRASEWIDKACNKCEPDH